MAVIFSDSTEVIDWSELAALYRAASLGNKSAESLKTVFANSRYRCFALAQGRLIGVGRALADGADCSYICDVAVLPGHQGSGIGKEIVARLVALSRGHRKIILYSVPGKEAFYQRFGFCRMRTAMAIFQNQEEAAACGYLEKTDRPLPG